MCVYRCVVDLVWPALKSVGRCWTAVAIVVVVVVASVVATTTNIATPAKAPKPMTASR